MDSFTAIDHTFEGVAAYAEIDFREDVTTSSLPASDGVRVSTGSATPTITDVAYIGGAGRSGSTVLALLLAQLRGFVAVGGLSNVWERGLRDNYLCGCGTPFRECPFWDEVGRTAFGGWDTLDVDEVLRLKLEVTRYRHSPWLVAPGLRPSFGGSLAAYADYVAPVYRAVTSLTGCRVVVDNSHDIPHALLLRELPDVRGRVIHLVRDSRGVAYSVSKNMLRAEVTTNSTYMNRYSSTEASGIWLLANLLYHVVPASQLPRLRVHYESLVASPAAEIARICTFLGSDPSAAELSALEHASIEIAENHMISGNPHRLGRKHVEVRLDEEWRAKMRPMDRRVVTLLTSPLALAYGYFGPRRSVRRGRGPGA